VEHLELTEGANSQNRSKGTLFSFIDHTNTAFGKRMLKRWLLAPLNDIVKLEERFNSIEDLI
jgi:DNA mismatch repair ATPase MutS